MIQALIGAAVRSATKEVLKEAAEKLIRNSARRAAALEQAGLVTKDVKKVRALQRSISDKGGLAKLTRNELSSVYRQVSELDASKGTRRRTAESVYTREQRTAHRDELIRKLKNPPLASRMTTEELKEAYAIQAKRLRDQVRRTEKQVGETHATRKYHEAREEFGSAKGKTRNQLLRQGNLMGRISNYEGITPAGARRQQQRGEQWFGPTWNTYTPEEQSAVWDEIKKYQVTHSVRSDVAIYEYREMIDNMGNHGIARIAFDRDPSSGKIRGVTFGYTQSDAEAKAARKRVDKKVMARIMSRSRPSILKW